MRNLIILFMITITLSGFSQNPGKKMTKSATGSKQKQEVRIVNFNELQTILNKNDNKLYVVNFWATWCSPCVMELPDFIKVNNIYKNNPHFKMILVSLDMAKEVETNVRPFLKKNNIDAQVYLLDDNKHMNEWIPAIDKNWTGAIPATVLYRNGKKLEFRESKLQKSELVQIINKHL